MFGGGDEDSLVWVDREVFGCDVQAVEA